MIQPAPPALQAQPAVPDDAGWQQTDESRQPLDSNQLLQGGRWVEIRHNGEVYRLQSTRLGKLILTK